MNSILQCRSCCSLQLWQVECSTQPPHDQTPTAIPSESHARCFATVSPAASTPASHEASNPQTTGSFSTPADVQQNPDVGQNQNPSVRVASLPADIDPSQIQQQSAQGGVGGRKEAAESFNGIPMPLFVREGLEGLGRGAVKVSPGGSSSEKAKDETVSLLEGIRRVRVSKRVRG